MHVGPRAERVRTKDFGLQHVFGTNEPHLAASDDIQPHPTATVKIA
jgi:hypothetical protein